MKYRVLTVNREFGSGGGRIAQTIAGWLGWKLLDRDIIDAIAYEAHVEARLVRHFDEHVGSWLSRFNHQAMRSAALAAGIEPGEDAVFDADQTVRLTQRIVEQAWSDGNCVVVGRGAQCLLQHRPDVLRRCGSASPACGAAWSQARISSSASARWMQSAPSICRSTSVRAGAIPTSTT